MKTIVITTCVIALIVIAILAARRMTPTRVSSANQELMVDTGATNRPKQLWTCGMHPQVIQDHPGFCPICHMRLVPLRAGSNDNSTQPANGKRKILYWWDPMLGPSSISNHPGKSAMGMDLVPVYADEQTGGPAVTIDPTVVQNMGVRTAVVSRGVLTKTVRAVGMLEVPEPAQYDINLRVNGWITRLYANQQGMHVHQGEALFDLYSPDLLVAGEELVGAIRAVESLDPNASHSLKVESQQLVDSAKQKLRLWGIADQDIDAIARNMKVPPGFPIRSPAHGDVMDKMVVEGSAVQAGMKLMRIEDHSQLWLDAEVFEENIPLMALGERVEATVEAVPGKIFAAPITFIYPHLDHMARTEMVRVTLDNPNHELSPGMYATVRIITRPVKDAVLIPREAVIDTGTRQIAFVARPGGHFEPRKVRMGLLADDDQVQILEGLAPGETVVTSGQFLMDVESRTAEAIDKLRSSQGISGGNTP